MKNILISLLLFVSLSAFSQDKFLIYKSNHQVDVFEISSIDSILVINEQLIIYQVDEELAIGYYVPFIDSMKVEDMGDYNPVLDNIFPPTSSKTIITDDVPGIPVWQLTDGSYECAAPYFEHQAFTDDDKYVVFRMKQNNQWRLYRSELRTGLVSLLSDRPLISPDGTQTLPFSSPTTDAGLFTIMPNGKEVAFLAGAANARKLYAVDVKTRTERVLFDAYAEINRQYGSKHDDLYTAKGLTCRVKGVAEPFLWMPVGNRATHETWSADGEKMFYFKKGNGNDVSVCSRSIEDATEVVYSTLNRLGHGVASPDMKYFVADQQVSANTNNSLYLINLETKTSQIICNPNATNSNGDYQYQHVHPSFSRSGNYVIYSSDRRGNGYNGKYQVFVVPVEEIK